MKLLLRPILFKETKLIKIMFFTILLSIGVSSCSNYPKKITNERSPASEAKLEIIKGDSLLFCSIPKEQDTTLELTFIVNTEPQDAKAWFVAEKNSVKGLLMVLDKFKTMRCKDCYDIWGKYAISEDQVFGFEAEIRNLSNGIGGTAVYQGSMAVQLSCERLDSRK